MTYRLARLVGVALFGLWFWWAYHRAIDLAVVSPVHWPLMLPQLVLEGIPAVIGAATASALVLVPRRSKPLAYLLCVSVVQSVVISAAIPNLERDYDRTIYESRSAWVPADAAPHVTVRSESPTEDVFP